MAVAHHLPQARFDVYERRCQPALALARVLPVVDLRAAFLDESIDGLKAVRRVSDIEDRELFSALRLEVGFAAIIIGFLAFVRLDPRL